ncbi:MAG: aminoglycoside 3'-phosphotransferase/choline kinase family protein [Candidatus Wallbacteria bacterium]|nr:aminoglycoside 3'-phosphotransferase/choline kinase family protein [Candidatus Wallbacteria bacterium]
MSSKKPFFASVSNDSEYHQFSDDDKALLRGIAEICRRHQLPVEKLYRFEKKGSLVFSVNDQFVIKPCAPIYRDGFLRESAFLKKVGVRMPDAVPELVAIGEIDKWPYIVMRQLPGAALEDAWDQINPENRLEIMEGLGKIVRKLHEIPVNEIPELDIDWPEFIGNQLKNCRINQKKKGLAPEWLLQIDGYLETFKHTAIKPVILHTELMRRHVFVEKKQSGWKITGLIDFEPSMMGDRDYEFASAGLFVSCGNSALFREFLSGYGMSEAEMIPELSRKCMQYTLLHKYCNLLWFMEENPVPGAGTLPELEKGWFSFLK